MCNRVWTHIQDTHQLQNLQYGCIHRFHWEESCTLNWYTALIQERGPWLTSTRGSVQLATHCPAWIPDFWEWKNLKAPIRTSILHLILELKITSIKQSRPAMQSPPKISVDYVFQGCRFLDRNQYAFKFLTGLQSFPKNKTKLKKNWMTVIIVPGTGENSQEQFLVYRTPLICIC